MRDDLLHPPTKEQGVNLPSEAKRYARMKGSKWITPGNGGTPKQKLFTKVNSRLLNAGRGTAFKNKDASASTSGKRLAEKLVDSLLAD